MSSPSELPLQKLQFYVTAPYKCGYLPNRLAQSLIAAPHQLVNTTVYSGLIQQGFRRSGKFAYRPHCEDCKACIAVRLKLDAFKPTRSQRRARKQHADLVAEVMPVQFNQAHFDLYSQYQQQRHRDSQDNLDTIGDEIEQYREFLCTSHVSSLMVEFKDPMGQVKIVSVIDAVHDGISAVYTFYDALEAKASYGTYSIMWLAEWAKNAGLPYLYLGYWIAESQKMAYKQQFQPQEKLIDGEWV
jgi:leucyl-tRNA---protein transferase